MALAQGRLKKGSSLGPYKIVRLIGEGGMGEVYEARDEILDRQVALKVVLPELSSAAEVIKRFTSEGQTLAKLNHQNVVTVHTLGEDKGIHYIVMEFVDGVSLWDLLQAKGHLEINQALHYFNQLLSGVKALHDHKIIHRDIKPKNIIVRRDNSVKIVDFGIAKVKGQQEREITATGAIIGSVYYISPECLEGEQASVQSDIWSLGVNLFEMLVGERPFQDDHRTRLIEKITTQEISFEKDKGKVPEGLQNIILKMCEKRPLDRYSSVAEIQRDIEAFKNSGYLRIPKTDFVPTAHSVSPSILKPLDRPAIPVSVGTKSHSFGRSDSRRVSAVSSSKPKIQTMHLAALGVAVLVIGAMAFMKMQSPNAEVAQESIQAPTPQYPVQEQVLWVSDQTPLQIAFNGQVAASDVLEVAKDPQFSEVVAEIQYPQSPQLVHPRAGQIFDDGKYYWRIVRKTSDEVHPLFEPLAFSILTTTAPSLSYPASHMNFPETKPVNIYWQEKTGAQNYRVEVAEDPRFKKVITAQIVRDTKFSLLQLPPGTYYWRVRVEEATGVSSWAEPRNFNIQKASSPIVAKAPPPTPPANAVGLMGLMNSASTAKPEPPKKTRPAPVVQPKARAVKKPIEKRPASVPKKKEISQPKAIPKKVTEATVVAPTPVEAAPPAPAAATPPAPAPAPAPAAPTRAVASVSPEKVKLAVPKLKLPPDGASIVALGSSQSPISFKWEAIEEAIQYRLEVSTNEKFSKIVHRSVVKENSMVLTKALPAGKLFWRLRSEKGPVKSDWSPVHSFEITK